MVRLAEFTLAAGELPESTVALLRWSLAYEEPIAITHDGGNYTYMMVWHWPEIALQYIEAPGAIGSRRFSLTSYCVTPIKYFAYHPTYRSYRSFTKLGRLMP